MTDLPPGWAWATLGEIASTQLGKMLSKKSKAGVRSRPYLRNKNVQWHRFDLDDVVDMDFTEEESAKFDLRAGDLLVCEGGEVGRCATWSAQMPDMHFQKALHRVRPTSGIHVKYLEYWLRWSADTGRFAGFTTGSTIGHLPQQDLRRLVVPLAPSGEQQRIVAAIEERFSWLDSAGASLNQAQRNVDRLRRAAVERLFASRDWAWTTLGEIAELKGGVTKDAKRQGDATFVMVPYLRVANVQRGRLDLTAVTTIRVSPDKAKALRLERGDVLFNEGGDRDKLGRGWVWEDQIADCIHQNHVFRARLLTDRFDPYFVSTHANTWGQRWFEQHGRQTTNLASISLSVLKQFPVPAPGPTEQRAVMANLDQITEGLDRLQSSLTSHHRHTEALRRSILAAAFSGRLVAQDPDDEPASVLLERIKAERASAGPSRGKKATT
ncbi:MAG: restriction endonuclease subunit S [Egibacteraceae bacterium]